MIIYKVYMHIAYEGPYGEQYFASFDKANQRLLELLEEGDNYCGKYRMSTIETED